MGALRAFVTLVFVLCIPAALVTTNIRFMANEPRIYRYAIDEYDAVLTTGLERSELIRAGAEIRQYFNNGQDTLAIRVNDDGREVPLFTPREVAHMKDVKDRFRLVNKVQEFSVLYLLLYIAAVVLWAREISTRGLAKAILGGSLLTLVAIGAVGALGMAGFESAWEDFHRLMFSNDFWLLNPTTDRLIQMFPPTFWESVVFLIGLLIAAEAALLVVASIIYLGATGHNQKPARRMPAPTPGYA